MIVDAFAAFGGYQLRPLKIGLDQLRGAMEKNGVDMAMTMSLRAVRYDVPSGNDRVCEIARSDSRILPVAVLDPRDYLNAERVIGAAVENGAVALAFHMTAMPCPLGSIAFRRVLRCAAEAGKPLVFVTNAPGEPTAIAEMTRDMGCAKVLLAGCSYERLTEMTALLEEFDHISVETSWQIIPRSIEMLCKAGGTGRVLFGSMAPLRPVRPALNMIADADLGPRERTDVLARNALRFIGRDREADSVADEPLEVLGIPPIPAIDVHCHLQVASVIPVRCLSVEESERERERFNIDVSIVSATAAYTDDMNEGNQQMLETVGASGHMLGSVVVNPHHLEDSIRWLDVAVKDPRIAHVTVHPVSTYERYGSAGWIRLFAEVAARRLALFFNTPGDDLYRRSPYEAKYGHLMRLRGAGDDEVAMLKRTGELFPQMPIVIGHGHGEEGLELARACGNIYLELCSSYPEQNVYRRVIDLIGADRVLFGTDLEAFSPAFVLGSLWEADPTEQEQRQILRENALRILDLDR